MNATDIHNALVEALVARFRASLPAELTELVESRPVEIREICQDSDEFEADSIYREPAGSYGWFDHVLSAYDADGNEVVFGVLEDDKTLCAVDEYDALPSRYQPSEAPEPEVAPEPVEAPEALSAPQTGRPARIHDQVIGYGLTFRLTSRVTGSVMTFKVTAPGGDPNEAVRFVSLVDKGDRSFLGTIFLDGERYVPSRKSAYRADDPVQAAFRWFWGAVSERAQAGETELPKSVQFEEIRA